MSWNRRDVFKLMTGAAALAAMGGRAAAEVAPHPDPAKFQSGDLLWPAKSNAIIPYSRSASAEKDREAAEWQKERDEFLRATPAPSDPEAKAVRDRLAAMSYAEFRALYLHDRGAAPTMRDFSLPEFSVGHVAILEIDAQGTVWVVEAMPKGSKSYEIVTGRFTYGIRRIAYSDWIGQHGKYKVWHGRVKADGAGAIAETAKTFLGRDYWIWALDFADETAFYCSKLVWVSAFKALGLALDGNPDKSRQLWLSPKRLMKLDTVTMLHSPGNYG
jgi:uncharacterized protein YycO